MLSHDFILALEPHRDSLYAAAVASVGPVHAESTLQNHARELFTQYVASQQINILQLLLQRLTPPGSLTPANLDPIPMPADVWARLAAAIQMAAAQTATTALPPDSTLLRPDPLLAPKKRPQRAVEKDGFDLSSPVRLFLVAGVALLAGVLATVYVVWWR